MIKVTVLYPNQPGNMFNMAYYCKTHIPLVQRLLGKAVKGVAVEQGIAGATPGSPAPFLAIGHILFESVEAFQKAFEAHAPEIMGDIPNYTNAQPTIQISEVKI